MSRSNEAEEEEVIGEGTGKLEIEEPNRYGNKVDEEINGVEFSDKACKQHNTVHRSPYTATIAMPITAELMGGMLNLAE